MRIHVRMALALTVLIGAAGCDKKADTPTAGETTMAPREAPPGTDWTETVAVTPEGGYVMGNPDAPVKFVEYASFTCSHCRDFARDATASLRDTYVKSGNGSSAVFRSIRSMWRRRCSSPVRGRGRYSNSWSRPFSNRINGYSPIRS